MVQLRVIAGGRESGASRKVRLFSAYSVMDDFQGHDCVKINWIHIGRVHPVARFEFLIDGYRKIDERMRFYFEEYVKELFTEREVEELRLRVQAALGTELKVVEEPVPISRIFVPMPFHNTKSGAKKGFFEPPEISEWDLPFAARGYYDLAKCPQSIAMPTTAVEMGTAFLEKALNALGLDSGSRDLKGAVESVYDISGLFVEKGKSLEERTRDRTEFLSRSAGQPRD